MSEKDQRTLNLLIKKVEQQEMTITQLVEIIAVTNRRVTDLAILLKERENQFLLS